MYSVIAERIVRSSDVKDSTVQQEIVVQCCGTQGENTEMRCNLTYAFYVYMHFA